MTKTHLIADESLGGVLQEYVEVDRKADVGEFVVTKFGISDHLFTEPMPYKVMYVECDGDISVIDNECEDHTLSPKFYRTLEPTDIVQIGGVRYRMVDREADVGEKVIVISKGSGWHGDKIGNVFTAIDSKKYGFEPGETYVDFEPSTECLSFIAKGNYRVLEPGDSDLVTVDTSEASPEVIDLLANLARRVSSLEQQMRDTQNNVERQAKEIAELEYANLERKSQQTVVINTSNVTVRENVDIAKIADALYAAVDEGVDR